MSEDDWAKLDAVFDVGARAEAATDSHGGELATAPQSEATIAVGSVSLKVVDDEAETCDADDANDENRANTSTSREVLNASVTGLVAGARSFGGGGADARCDLRAMDLDVGGVKFSSSVETLTVSGSAYFKAMFSGAWKRDDSAPIFIDRDPAMFGVILRYESA